MLYMTYSSVVLRYWTSRERDGSLDRVYDSSEEPPFIYYMSFFLIVNALYISYYVAGVFSTSIVSLFWLLPSLGAVKL